MCPGQRLGRLGGWHLGQRVKGQGGVSSGAQCGQLGGASWENVGAAPWTLPRAQMRLHLGLPVPVQPAPWEWRTLSWRAWQVPLLELTAFQRSGGQEARC